MSTTTWSQTDTPPDAPATDAITPDLQPDEAEITQAFFDREPPEGYLQEWSQRLARPGQVEEPDQRSVVVFRLQGEWLAIETAVLIEVTQPHPIHSIPHRTTKTLLGLVNVRGQLRICVSLHALLEVEAASHAGPPQTPSRDDQSQSALKRMMIIQDRADHWVFPVEEVGGVTRLRQGALRKVPSTFGPTSSYCQAVFDWNNHTVGYLDHTRLLSSLGSLCA